MTISIIYSTCCSFNIVVYSTVLHLKKNNKLNKSTQIYICCSQTEVKSDKTLTTSENLLPMPILTCALTWFPVQIGRIGRRGGASISDDTDPETVVHVGSESCHLVAPLGCLVHNGGP